MKKFSASITLLALAFQSVPAMAWVGGPYSNNTTDGKSGGVFQGTMTFKNGSGSFKFATGAEPFISPQASSVVMHEGLVYYGDAFGTADFESKTITCITNGNTNIGVVTPVTSLFNATVTITSSETPIGTPSFPFGNGSDNGVCNTQFAGKINKTAPGTTFKGKGWAYVFSADEFDVKDTSTSTGPASDYLPIFSAVGIISGYFEVKPNDSTQTQELSRDVKPAEKRKFRTRVFGSRVSTIAYTAFGQASTTP